jgi:hypothetical protein
MAKRQKCVKDLKKLIYDFYLRMWSKIYNNDEAS